MPSLNYHQNSAVSEYGQFMFAITNKKITDRKTGKNVNKSVVWWSFVNKASEADKLMRGTHEKYYLT